MFATTAVHGKKRTQPAVSVIALIALLSGCSSLTTSQAPPPPATADCQALATLFSQSHDGFQDLRQRPTYRYRVTLWETDYQLIDDSCQVWQWSDKYSYICSRVFPDQAIADQVYQQARAHIASCQGNALTDWSLQQGDLPEDGTQVQYIFGDQVRGALRAQKTTGLFRDSWSVYFWINSPPMLP